MRRADIEKLISVGRPTIAPDASFAVFASSRPDLAANRSVGQLWRVELPGGVPRRLTRGVADREPALGPDGDVLAFLRPDDAGHAQVFIVAPAGGEPVRVTDAPLGVSAFAWSPRGDTIAYTARIPERGRYGSVEGLDSAAESPRRVTGVRWHANGLGYTADRPAQLFLVTVPSVDTEPFYAPAAAVRPDGEEAPSVRVAAGDATALTSGTASLSAPRFTADGTEVLVIVDEIESDARDLRTPVRAVRVDGAGERELLSRDSLLAIDEIAVAPDGAIVLLAADVGRSGTDFVAPGTALWILEEDGPRRLTDSESIDLGEVGSHVSFVGEDVLVQDRRRGRVRLLRVTRSGEVSEVLAGDVEVVGHATAAGRVVAAIATPDSFGELVVVDVGTPSAAHPDEALAAPRVLTSFGDPLRSAIVAPVELEVTGRDGYPVHGWIATPAGDGPFPVILQIHGGPYASYGIHVFDETQVLVDAGYTVVYCNPRGSAGYGRAHGRSIRQQMGTLDFTDVIDFLDGAIASDARLDPERVGVMGGSYGGYLTAWVIAHDHRFAAAIVERGFLDPFSFQGTSDIGSFFGDEYVGTDPAAMTAQSPMAVVEHVRTPTLVIHSEEDFRCPLEQATRYYAALRRHGVDAEMLLFPGENHELTRAGSPRHRIERFDAVLDWWTRHLPVG